MSAPHPFSILSDFARRSHDKAQGLPAQVNIATHWSGIGFNLLGHRMVAPMGEIVEILKVPSYTRLPGVHPWVLGVANVRGKLLPLFDLEAFFGGQLSNQKQRHRVLILEMGEMYSGLIVNEVFGMQHFPIDTFTQSVSSTVEKMGQYTNGSYVQMDMNWMVFSPYLLAKDPRFFSAAAA